MRGATAGQALVLRGYGPMVAFMIFFALMVALVPTVASETQLAGESGESEGSEGGAVPSNTPAEQDASARAEPERLDAEPGTSPEEALSPDGNDAEATREDSDGTTNNGVAQGVHPCEDRELQVPGDPYSPPCVVSTGGNPGATHRGVTAEEVVISARTPDQPNLVDQIGSLTGAEIQDTQEDVRRTISALAEYFNERFEFHGRKLRIEFFDGQGSFEEEAQGRGQERAHQDALTVADEIQAFGELTGFPEPFANALAQEGVLSFMGIHYPRGYHVDRRPHKWSTFTDCSTVVEAASEWAVKRLYGRKAEFAGPEFRDRERDIVAVGPENPTYQACVDDAERVYVEHGEPIPDIINYRVDVATMSNQAANIIARLQDRGVTTVAAFVDPIMAVFLTARAEEQGYEPEWIISGAAYMDMDLIGQVQQQDQWSRAFGTSFGGQTQHRQQELGYHAYKQVRDDEPAVRVDSWYQGMYLLAVGIQGAGPELTPETFEQAMFDYPGGTGPMGTWGFGPDNYTSTEDFREIYYDPEAISPYNNEPGAYLETDPGVRLEPGGVPDGPPRLP